MAYFQVEPFGEERADLRAGVIASILVNINRRRGATVSKPSDFILYKGTPAIKTKILSEQIKDSFKRFPRVN